MSRTLSLEVRIVQAVLCKLSVLACAKQTVLTCRPASACTTHGAEHPVTVLSPHAWTGHCAGDKKSARLAQGLAVPLGLLPAPAQPGPSPAAPALLLQSKMFTYSPAFLQQLESRLKYRKHDIICLLQQKTD